MGSCVKVIRQCEAVWIVSRMIACSCDSPRKWLSKMINIRSGLSVVEMRFGESCSYLIWFWRGQFELFKVVLRSMHTQQSSQEPAPVKIVASAVKVRYKCSKTLTASFNTSVSIVLDKKKSSNQAYTIWSDTYFKWIPASDNMCTVYLINSLNGRLGDWSLFGWLFLWRKTMIESLCLLFEAKLLQWLLRRMLISIHPI